MIITNNHNLPQAFVDMATTEYSYAPNEYRVTSLLRGLRETMLLRRHNDEIEVDVADMVWMLFGTAVHDVLERAQESESELKEERLKVAIGDYILSGQFDLYSADDKELTDYKTTSVWKIVHKNFDDWQRQLLIYAYMMEHYGFPVEKTKVVAFLKDHKKSEAKFNMDYPNLPVHTVHFKVIKEDLDYVGRWLDYRFGEVAEAETLDDDDLPYCTEEERWASPDVYAVMKEGRKSAVRLFECEEDARDYIESEVKEKDRPVHSIVLRKGESRKCEEYCFVNQFCKYYKEAH